MKLDNIRRKNPNKIKKSTNPIADPGVRYRLAIIARYESLLT